MQEQGQGPSLQGQGLDLEGQDLTHKDKDKDFTYSYLLQVAAKPTIAIKQQKWTQSESSQHMTVQEAQLMLTTCLAVSRGQQNGTILGPLWLFAKHVTATTHHKSVGLDLRGQRQGQGLKFGP